MTVIFSRRYLCKYMLAEEDRIDRGLINRDSESTFRTSIEGEDAVVPAPVKERLKSIDIYRGLTMFGMILADNQGRDAIWPLDHVSWNGLSTADLVFPSFLFIMGFAVPLAVRKPIKPLRLTLRIAGLFLIGFILNIGESRFEFSDVRVLGVLQRISMCYAIVVAIHIATQYGKKHLRKYGAMFVAVMMAVYIGLMMSFQDGPACTLENNLTKNCNFSRWLDLKIFTDKHMMGPTDPEGLFPTLSSLTTAYGG